MSKGAASATASSPVERPTSSFDLPIAESTSAPRQVPADPSPTGPPLVPLLLVSPLLVPPLLVPLLLVPLLLVPLLLVPLLLVPLLLVSPLLDAPPLLEACPAPGPFPLDPPQLAPEPIPNVIAMAQRPPRKRPHCPMRPRIRQELEATAGPSRPDRKS